MEAEIIYAEPVVLTSPPRDRDIRPSRPMEELVFGKKKSQCYRDARGKYINTI